MLWLMIGRRGDARILAVLGLTIFLWTKGIKTFVFGTGLFVDVSYCYVSRNIFIEIGVTCEVLANLDMYMVVL